MNRTESDDESLQWQPVAGWILLGFVLRTIAGAVTPLFPDETYYWMWSRNLAVGYFDHPPAIAWLIAAGTAIFGDNALGVRFGPALAAVVTHIVVAVAAFQLGGVHAARRAVMLTTLLPIATLGLVLATPDAPLFAFAMITLWCIDRALSHTPGASGSTWWWCAAGVALGLAMLGKYTAVLLPASLFVACVVHPELRPRFREPGPWLAAIIAALIFAPVIVWNARQDWVSFRFQLGHGFGSGADGNLVTRELELVGGQLALVTPILASLLAVVAWRTLRSRGHPQTSTAAVDGRSSVNGTMPARRFALAAMTLGPLVFFAISATRRSVEPNWPGLAYPAAILLLASSTSALANGRWWTRGLQLAAVLLAIVSVQVVHPVLPVAPPKDPVARAYGWDQLAVVMDSVSRSATPTNGATPHLAAERYQDASELSFHLPQQPMVYSLNINSRDNQYDLWETAYDVIRPGDDLVALFEASPDGATRARLVGEWFGDTEEGPGVALRRRAGEVGHRRIWVFRDARSVPRDSAGPSLH